MKIRKGTFKIATVSSDAYEKQGRYGYSYPFMVHKSEGEYLWSVSHIPTGFSISKKCTTLKKAASVAEKLKEFPVFLMPTIETWNKAKNRMMKQQPEQYNKMIDIVYLRDEK